MSEKNSILRLIDTVTSRFIHVVNTKLVCTSHLSTSSSYFLLSRPAEACWDRMWQACEQRLTAWSSRVYIWRSGLMTLEVQLSPARRERPRCATQRRGPEQHIPIKRSCLKSTWSEYILRCSRVLAVTVSHIIETEAFTCPEPAQDRSHL